MITVVILPGMDGTGIGLTDFVAALAPELEAIVVTYPNDRPMDYAGHEVGRSSEPSGRQAVRASRRIVFRPDRHFDRRVRSAWAHRPGIVLLVCAEPATRRSRGHVGSCRSCRRASPPLFPAGSCWGGFRRRGSRTPSLKFSLKSPPTRFELA